MTRGGTVEDDARLLIATGGSPPLEDCILFLNTVLQISRVNYTIFVLKSTKKFKSNEKPGRDTREQDKIKGGPLLLVGRVQPSPVRIWLRTGRLPT